MKKLFKTFIPGDLVRWYEYYADNIIKDGGVGTVINLDTHYEPTGLATYRVLKQETGEISLFSDYNLDHYNENPILKANI